jgi:hypothetical protein
MIAVTLPKQAEKYLGFMAHDAGRTAEALASEALENWIENQALLKIGEQRKAEWIADGCKSVSWTQIKAENGL